VRLQGAVARDRLDTCAADGARLRIQVVKPVRGGEGAPSVLMVHGFAQNHRCWDAPGRSLAEHLASAGLWVFLGDLRGHGDSAPAPSGRAPGFPEHCDLDVPAMVDAVHAARPGHPVVYVGHSAGGLLGAALPLEAAAKLDRMCLLCSPVRFMPGWGGWRAGLSLAARALAGVGGWLPTDHLGRVLLEARPALDAPGHRFPLPVWAPGTVDAPVLTHALTSAFERESARWLADLLELGATEGTWCGPVPFGARLAALRVPLLVVAGDLDGLAPLEAVRPLYERAGSAHKRFVLVGCQEGHCGHVDVLVGSQAPRAVWPLVRQFARSGLVTATA
jgi:pimeloyl-ACP methyl ester carboxylesterase